MTCSIHGSAWCSCPPITDDDELLGVSPMTTPPADRIIHKPGCAARTYLRAPSRWPCDCGAVTAPADPVQWEPIETAPVDGVQGVYTDDCECGR
jgi:hypothetical protein